MHDTGYHQIAEMAQAKGVPKLFKIWVSTHAHIRFTPQGTYVRFYIDPETSLRLRLLEVRGG